MKIGEISAGSLLKLGLVCGGSFWFCLGLLFGVLALSGFETVSMNRAPVFGLTGLLISLLVSSVLTIMTGVAIMLGGLVSRAIPSFRSIEVAQSGLVRLEHPLEERGLD